jgi:AcrR family transcriptional regulator
LKAVEDQAVGGRRVGRPRGPRRDPAERREELLAAAVTAIREHGPEVSMAELAEAAGVTRPILYDHFGDRAGVAAALAERFAAELAAGLAGVFAGPVPARAAIARGIDLFCRFVDKEPDVYRFLQATASPADAATMESTVGRPLGEIFAAALAAAGADPAMGQTWGHAVLGMVFAAAEWWSLTRRISRQELVAHLTDLLAGGLSGAGITTFGGSPDR